MDHFNKLRKKDDIEVFVKAVLKRKDFILYLPDCMLEYYRKKVRNEFKDYSAFFGILIDAANNQKPLNPMLEIYKKIFGYYYKPIVKEVKHYARQKEFKAIQKTLKPEGIENFAREQISKLQVDTKLASMWGRCTTRKSVPISIVDDYGYGEWISKNVSYNTNRYFIYSNNNRLTNVELEHYVYFNIYPGLAHFYDIVADEKNRIRFDNGATYFINGWGMYAMCRCRNSAFSTSLLIESSIIAKNLLNKNLAKAYEDVYVYLLSRYPKAKALDYMRDYTQYPGHYLSYVLGGCAFNQLMKNNFATTPEDLLKSLAHINCGDHFAIYHPKVQKKIAKHSITAKVAPKFN
jgi:hypothetical protein